mgnify:CR=1 FL=1
MALPMNAQVDPRDVHAQARLLHDRARPDAPHQRVAEPRRGHDRPERCARHQAPSKHDVVPSTPCAVREVPARRPVPARRQGAFKKCEMNRLELATSHAPGDGGW